MNSGSRNLNSKLFVTWCCSVLWEVGSLLAVFIWIIFGFSGFGTSLPPIINPALFTVGLVVVLVAPGPIVLGILLTRSRRGIKSGVFATIACVVAFWLEWLLLGVENTTLLLSIISATVVITTVILASIKFSPLLFRVLCDVQTSPIGTPIPLLR